MSNQEAQRYRLVDEPDSTFLLGAAQLLKWLVRDKVYPQGQFLPSFSIIGWMNLRKECKVRRICHDCSIHEERQELICSCQNMVIWLWCIRFLMSVQQLQKSWFSVGPSVQATNNHHHETTSRHQADSKQLYLVDNLLGVSTSSVEGGKALIIVLSWLISSNPPRRNW